MDSKFKLTAPDISEQDLAAIQLAIEELWPELTLSTKTDLSTDNKWKFSGRWWLNGEDY
tara:strand:+ start:1909 stop:2085 length:177 start_codon:yes stop_codon:yes gene_type:complete